MVALSKEVMLAVALPHLGGIAGGLITRREVPDWYDKRLRKPAWRPPNWAFGPVWSLLYTGMGYASYLVWRDGGGFDGEAKFPLYLYGAQLALNWMWTPIFFKWHKIGWAFAEMLALDVAVLACIRSFGSVSQDATVLMVPYFLWLGVATALNFRIWRDNPSASGDSIAISTHQK